MGLTKEFTAKFAGGRNVTLELDPGTTIKDLLHQLPSIGPPDAWDDMMLMVFVNGEAKGFDYVLLDGDTIDLHIPVSGG